MAFLVSKSASCRHNFSHVCLPSCVCIVVEECIKILNLFDIEGGILCNNGLIEYNLSLIFKDNLAIDFAHGYIS